jgi:hypothetical protein
MRSFILPFVLAAAALSVSACASAPVHHAASADIPMYTPAEWTAMNSISTVPDLPANEVASADMEPSRALGFSSRGLDAFYRTSNVHQTTAYYSFNPSATRTTITAASTSHSSSSGHR